MRRALQRRLLPLLFASLALVCGLAMEAAQAASAQQTIHVTGLRQDGDQGVLVNITLSIPAGVDAAGIVDDALARHGAKPVTNCSQLPILFWPQFFDKTNKSPFVPQYYNPAGDTTPGGAMQALQAGEVEWSAVPKSAYSVQFQSTTGAGPAFDGINTVGWLTPWPLNPNALAVTQTYFRFSTGEIVEADTLINGQNFEFFANPVDLTPTRYDIRYVLLHENGHAAGLCHSPDPNAVMYPAFGPGVIGHGLAPDDMDQMVWLYPNAPGQAMRFPRPQAIRVPEDYPSIQLAINSAQPRDVIRVGPGRWCGARVTKTLNLVGEGGATIIGCPPGVPGPVGNAVKRGFVVDAAASGTSISQFVFDGNGLSDVNRDPLSRGIQSTAGANNLVIGANTFLGGAFGVFVIGGNNVQVTRNSFNGFRVLGNGDGGAAILDIGRVGRATGHSILDNRVSSSVPLGDYSWASWVNEADVPLAGIVVSALDGGLLSNNKVSITANANGDAGVGILATDLLTGLTTINLAITNNDGRGSAYGLIITKDLSGGTGNTVGAAIRGNFGVNQINGWNSSVRNRSRVLLCDPDTGICQ
ncbi:matrixin family metalloprotease [Roseateles saccharophilus]|uniref:Matrixin n=1 Tax=Roseateles saccharophilus TaxID=304 RepID=A0A4R3UF77_ROSSA|nr:matrixin family metalloprotease [Roseateles saccharophilus]TCU86858.1 matrixin [Roseateles saccharophilus]